MGKLARVRNEPLTAVLAETGLSFAGLAHRVNLTGRERGLTLRYQKSGVGNWVCGGNVPRAEVREIVLEILSARAGRRVTGPDVAWPATEADDAISRTLAYLELSEVHTVLPALWSGHMLDRRAFTATTAVASFGTVLADYLTSTPDASAAHTGGNRRVGETDVAMVRDITAHLRAMDAAYGSGPFRDDAITALHRHVAPLLRGSYSDPVGRALYAAIAELSALTGWLIFDTGAPGVAARYYTTSLRLARAANNPQLCAEIMQRMAYLALRAEGDGRECLRIANAAALQNRRLSSSNALSQARAHGALGNTIDVRRLVNEAFDAWANEAGHDNTEALTELHCRAASTYADAGMIEGLEHADLAIARREHTRQVRPLATNYVHRAVILLRHSDPHAAIDAADQALAMAPAINSAQLTRRLTTFGRQLTRTYNNHATTAFTDRLRHTLTNA